jgi:hypothetical protein
MSFVRFTPATSAYYAESAERHLMWALEYALAGDLESAIEAIRDVHAIAVELIEDGA